jgi:hypothetical protein
VEKPLHAIQGLFHRATVVIKSISTGTPIRLASKQLGNFDNLARQKCNMS